MAWTWKFEDAEDAAVTPDYDVPEFTSQSDAETWLGEVWRDLVAAGATKANLHDDDRLVYGPMSLLSE